MAKFLRDEYLENFTVTEQILDQINDFLTERETATNLKLEQEDAGDEQLLLLNYIIRFDNRGYKPNEFSDLKKYYDQAINVERLIFTLDSTQSVSTNQLYGETHRVASCSLPLTHNKM